MMCNINAGNGISLPRLRSHKLITILFKLRRFQSITKLFYKLPSSSSSISPSSPLLSWLNRGQMFSYAQRSAHYRIMQDVAANPIICEFNLSVQKFAHVTPSDWYFTLYWVKGLVCQNHLVAWATSSISALCGIADTSTREGSALTSFDTTFIWRNNVTFSR